MPTVQFYGIDQVIEAAENYKCPNWAIFIARAMFFKFEGTDMEQSIAMLQTNLEMLQQNTSTATYMIKFFENENGKEMKINEKTICTGGSFYFKLNDPEEKQQRFLGAAQQYGNKMLMDEIAKLKEQIEDLKDHEPEKPETIGSIFMDALKNPTEAMQLVNLGRVLLGLEPKQMPAALAGVPGNSEPVDQEQQLQRLGNAIDKLEKVDPHLIDHLEILAEMAEKNPAKLKSLLAML